MKTTFKTVRIGMLAAPLAVIAGMASAGGLSEPVETPAPVPVTPAPVVVMSGSDWTGFYAGVQLGYGQLDADELTGDPEGLLYGAHAGYLYDFGQWVVGAELDIDGTDIEDEDVGVTVDAVTRAKLRVGYDGGAWLPYVTGGIAQVRTSSDIAILDTDDTGPFGGIGVEYRVSPGVRIGGEILQHRFDDYNGSGADIDATTATARVSFQF